MGIKRKTNGVGVSSAILTLSKIITMMISLVSGMLLSRFRTLEEYGTYSQILIVVQLATSLFTIGLPNSTNYFIARSNSSKERREFLSVFFTVTTLLCLVMGVVLVVIVPLIESYFNNPSISDYIFFVGIYPWTCVIISTVSNILVAYGKASKLMLFNIINACVVLFSILLVRVFNWSFWHYLLILLCGEFLMMLWVYYIVWKLEHPLKISFNGEIIRKLLKYSIPIGIAGLVGTVSIEIDKLMIGWFFTTEELAIYTNAAKELPLTIVATSLTAILLPQFARMMKQNEAPQAVKLWGSSILLSYIIICFFTMGLITFAPQVIVFLYSAKYLPGVTVFRVYSLHLLLRCTYFGIVLNSIGKTKFIFYSSLVSLALNAVLNYLLYLLFGMVGPAIATALSLGIVGLGQLIATGKEINMPITKLIPWKGLLKITCINLVIGLALYTLSLIIGLKTSTKDVFIAVALGIISLIIYLVIMLKPIKKLWGDLNQVEVSISE